MEEPLFTSTPKPRKKLEEPAGVKGTGESQSQSQSQQEMKKNRKKATNKQQRQVKREDKFYKEFYKPKDSHISLLDPELFQKIKGNSSNPISFPSSSSSRRGDLAAAVGASEFRFTVDPNNRQASLEFPSLGTELLGSTKSRYQSFVTSGVGTSETVPATTVVLTQETPTAAAAATTTADAAATTTADTAATLTAAAAVTPTAAAAATPTATVAAIPTAASATATLQSNSTVTDRLSFSSVLNNEKPLHPVTVPVPSPPALTPSKQNQNQNQKLSKKPLVISLGDLISIRKVKDKHIIGKQIGKKKNDRSSVKKENFKLTVGNLLDSSGTGIIHRGKIRLKPKKPSKLKKAIMKSRELRKSGIAGEAYIEPQSSNEVGDAEGSVATLVSKCDIIIKSEPEDGKKAEEVRKCGALDDVNSAKEERKPFLPRIKTESQETTDEKKGFENVESEIFKAIMENAEVEAKLPPPVPIGIVEYVKIQMHSRKFRPYCDMWTSKELHGLVIHLLKELHRLQDRLYQTDPIKFKTKRRFVNGLKDVVNFLRINKAQMVILAPDIEPSQEKGGLDDKITEIVELAKEKNVPYIFSGGRFILGKPIRTKTPVSAIAIVDKQSQEEQFNKILEKAAVLREAYQSTFEHLVKEAIKLDTTVDKKPSSMSINSALNMNFKSK